MRRLVMLTGLLALLFVIVPAANAAPMKFIANLDGPSENPSVPTPATGTAWAEIDPVANTIKISAVWSGLVEPTTVAHIHCCVAAPGNIGVAVSPGTLTGFPAGVTSGSYSGTFDTEAAITYTAAFVTNFGGSTLPGAEAALVSALAGGRAYFNIHTTFRPGGEIRGFFREVPTPGAFGLFAVSLAGLAALRRKRNG